MFVKNLCKVIRFCYVILVSKRLTSTTNRICEPGLNDMENVKGKKSNFTIEQIQIHQITSPAISENIRSIALDSLSRDMSAFRSNGINLADFTIICQDKTFPVHSSFLCSRSTVFAAMLTHDTKEARERKLEIVDATSDIVNLLLRYLFFFKQMICLFQVS